MIALVTPGWAIGERHREMGHRQARLVGERNDLLDGVEPTLVTEARAEGGAAEIGVVTFAGAPVSIARASGLHTSVPIP
jgi:hypothetical protein